MKSNKGITLVSLIIYVIVMLIVVTIIGSITGFFYANVNDEYKNSKDEYKSSNLELYLVNDLKNKEIFVTDGNGKTTFKNGEAPIPIYTIKFIYEDLSQITYSIKDDGIYRNSIKIYDKPLANDMYFEISDSKSNNSGSLINEKREIKIIKENQIEGGEITTTVFKSYTVNIKPKPNFPSATPTP